MEKKSDSKLAKRPIGHKSSKATVSASRNPFINFLMEFRKRNPSLKSKQLISRGAEQWRRMNESEKTPYFEMAKKAPKRRRHKASTKSRRGRRRGRSRSRAKSVNRSDE